MRIYNQIIGNDNSERPGWVRMSLHPTVSNKEVQFILDALCKVADRIEEWEKDYTYDKRKNSFYHNTKQCQAIEKEQVEEWYNEVLA